jgi:superfamily I DNA and/or RNA helicase
LANNIPLEKNYFDLSIIDEASQLLLSHSIGTLYRSKRILIAGDSQQMAPSSYFNAKDENALTVLHKASFYFKNILLHYHFRSEHPALIAYSNEHFYNNELVAFPSVSQDQMPIKFHEVKNGIYSNRTNEQEAKKVANHLASLLGNKSEKIGLVAFSETQLESIFQQLNAADRIRLLTRIDEDSLFFKALEQVQGDECDRLIISFGYAKNENGQFEMRFGPVNEKNGSKRLNVLFSRARKNIDFFASVKSEDFALSSNNSIRLLWRWFVFIEREQLKQNEVAFPFECTISQKKNLLSMADWSDLSSNANDMLTIIRTLKMRGWQLGIH